jgi:hypothetical protein
MNRAPDQNAVKGAVALAADSHDTQTPASECCAYPEIAIQLGRLVEAIEKQTVSIELAALQISAAMFFESNSFLCMTEDCLVEKAIEIRTLVREQNRRRP